MKKIFDEKVGLAINVSSAVAVGILLLGAYLYRNGNKNAENHSIEKQKFHMEAQKF